MTRSGTNRFSGTGYEFFRNGALDARNHFAPEGRARPRTTAATSSAAPSAGRSPQPDVLLRRLRGHAAARGDHPGHQRAHRRRAGRRLLAVAVSAAHRSAHAASRSGQQIPPFFINPIGSAIAALYPLPNRNTPFANFVSSPTDRDDVDQFDVKIDHIASTAAARCRRATASRTARCSSRSPAPGSRRCPAMATRRPPRAESRWRDVRPRGRLSTTLRVGYKRVGDRVNPEDPQHRQRVGRPAIAVHEPARRGLSFITVTGYLAARPRIQQSAGEHRDDVPDRGHGDLESRRTPDQVRRRVVRRAPDGVPRRAGPRLPDLRASGVTPAMHSPTC